MKRLLITALITALLSGCAFVCGAFVLAQVRAEGAVERWEAALELDHPDAAENLLRAHAALAAARLAVKACEGRAEKAESLEDGSVVSLVSLEPLRYVVTLPGAVDSSTPIDFAAELAGLEAP